MIRQNNSAYSPRERLINGIFRENPIFVLVLGICPTLATTTSAINGFVMGLATAVVLTLSNVTISLLRNVIPYKVRIPAFIVIIASFVTMMQLILQAYIPILYNSLGIYIPLIVVNCIVLGRAETFASKENTLLSFFDGLGMGIGFTIALTIIGVFREWLGAGKIFGFQAMPSSYVPITIFVLAPGAFFVLAFLTAIQNKIKIIGIKNGKDMPKTGTFCSEECMNCPEKNGSNQSISDTIMNDKPEIKEEIVVTKNSTPASDENTEPKKVSGRKKTTTKKLKEINEEEKKSKKAEYKTELDAYSSTDEEYNSSTDEDNNSSADEDNNSSTDEELPKLETENQHYLNYQEENAEESEGEN